MSEKKVHSCNSSRCSICSQMISGNEFEFNCGFVFQVPDENLDCNTMGVVYVLRCTTCRAEYIGETKNIRHRIHTHNSHIRTNRRLCRATDHLIECGAKLKNVQDRFQLFLLEKEENTAVRKAKESFYIRLFLPKMYK